MVRGVAATANDRQGEKCAVAWSDVVVVVVVASESRGSGRKAKSKSAELKPSSLEQPLPSRVTAMATHAVVEQGQGEHDVPNSAFAIMHWYCIYALRPPLHWVGCCGRQTWRDVNTKAHKHPHYANYAIEGFHNEAHSTCNMLPSTAVASLTSSPTSRCRQRAGLMKKIEGHARQL